LLEAKTINIENLMLFNNSTFKKIQ